MTMLAGLGLVGFRVSRRQAWTPGRNRQQPASRRVFSCRPGAPRQPAGDIWYLYHV